MEKTFDKKIVQELLEYKELFIDEYLAYDKEHALEIHLIYKDGLTPEYFIENFSRV